MQTFFNRRDAYALQKKDGRYFYIQEPLTLELVLQHLRGEITLGSYLLSAKHRCKFAVIDADDDPERSKLVEIHRTFPLPSYLEASRRGGHLWFFFSEPVPGARAKAFGREVARMYELSAEIFPKQATSKGPGSCIRLPLGVHRKTGDRYPFIGLGDWRSQLNGISSPETIPTAEVMQFQYKERVRKRRRLPLNGEMPVWEKIKRLVTVQEMVSQYVELSDKGVGRCPFHDDEHASFSVNLEENYWHCFSGCGGGSVIDFWMKLNNMTFQQAVEDLGERLKIS
jgi:hypothetical protein